MKGTASAGIAWPQLKVSSLHSHKLLVEAGIPVYRVSEVFSAAPSIYVLRHGADFVLEEEARWAFTPSGSRGQRVRDQPAETIIEPGATLESTQTSKYDALRRYLGRQQDDEVTLAFKDAVDVLGFSLPSSAYKYQAFWANQTNTTNRPWVRAWQNAGYEVAAHLLSDDGWVRFRRRKPEPEHAADPTAPRKGDRAVGRATEGLL